MSKTKVQKQISKHQISMSEQSLQKKHQHQNFQIEIVDQIYNQKLKKYLDYYWIQKSIIRNAASRTFKRAKDQLSHINRFYIFLPTTCTSTQDIDLTRDNFSKFYNLIYFIVALLEHAITRFQDIFGLFIWKRKGYLWLALNALHQVAVGQDQEVQNNHELDNSLVGD